MALLPLNFPPGVHRNGTDYQNKGQYFDANLVRWYSGTIQPIKGWRLRTSTTLSGVPRAALSWRGNNATKWAAVGTNTKLYALEGGLTVHDITPTGFTTGGANAVGSVGYGTQDFGEYTYGTPRVETSTTGITPVATWHLDTWGQNLVACAPQDGKIYEWSLNTANDAVVITNAPTNNKGVAVTAERIMFALGASGNPRLIKWTDVEDNTDWTASATNQAGDYELQTPGTIQSARRVRDGMLIFTDCDTWIARYQGPPFVYGFDKVGTACGIISANAVTTVETYAVWMGESGFWMYDGYVKPLPSTVQDYVFSNISSTQLSKTVAVNNTTYGEVWWFYPSSESQENNRYVLWNYRENTWSIGQLARTAGDDSGVFPFPIMTAPDGKIYEHETGFNYDGATPYVESGPIEVGNGDNVVMMRQIVPDEKTQGDVQARVYARFYPNAEETEYGPYSMAAPTDVRLSARQIRVRYEGVRSTDWRIGVMRIEGTVGGFR
jgi:hypothetical protein